MNQKNYFRFEKLEVWKDAFVSQEQFNAIYDFALKVDAKLNAFLKALSVKR